MAILAECPRCRKKQAGKNRLCQCGEDLIQAKKSKRIRYWISYRLPGGKQRREFVGYSIQQARDAEGKRRGQKRENRFFEMLPEANMTFNELTEWYLSLEKVKGLNSYDTVKIYLNKFNQEFGGVIVGNIKPAELENLQEKRKQEGLKPKTVDSELNYAKQMIIKAFDNDLVGGNVVKAFRKVKKTLKRHSNRRDRILTREEFKALHEKAPRHLKDILTMGYWTGMRKGEIIKLLWDRVDLKREIINLKAEDTKDREPRVIPISDEVNKMLTRLPRPIHGGHVFLYNGKPIKIRFEISLKRACDKASILWGRNVKDGFVFHDLRHTFVTDARKAGIDRTVRMAITGHAIQDMDQRYDSVDLNDKLEAIKMLEKYRSVDQNVDQKTVTN